MALQVVDTNVVIPGRDNKDVAIDKKSSMSTPVNQHPKRKFSDVMSVLKDFSPMLKDNKIQQDAAQDLLKSLKEEFDVTLTPQSTKPEEVEEKIEDVPTPVCENNVTVESSPMIEEEQAEFVAVKSTKSSSKSSNMVKFRAHNETSLNSQPACTLCNIL